MTFDPASAGLGGILIGGALLGRALPLATREQVAEQPLAGEGTP